MIICASRAQAAGTRQNYTTADGCQTSVETYMGTNRARIAGGGESEMPVGIDAGATYPMAYLVSQAPGSSLAAHYHQADQFQLFVGGSGRIGTHPLRPLTVHFAGSHSPYGPLVAGSGGLQYLTLRRNWDPGAQYMPQAAQRLRELPGRRHRAQTSTPFALDSPPAQDAGTIRMTRLLSEDAMGAWLLQLGPEAEYAASASADCFVYVLSGHMAVREQVLACGACVFVSTEEDPLCLRTGASGARLVLAQFDNQRPLESIALSRTA